MIIIKHYSDKHTSRIESFREILRSIRKVQAAIYTCSQMDCDKVTQIATSDQRDVPFNITNSDVTLQKQISAFQFRTLQRTYIYIRRR